MDLTFPSNPSVNQTHTFANKQWKWNGSAWDAILETGGGGGTGTVRYTIGTTAPGDPVTGDKWFNTTVGLELTYLENKWVAVNAAQGNETTWSRDDGTTETVGGIPAGSTFSLGTTSTAILEQLLYPYQNVSFSDFDIGISSPREVGNTATSQAYNATWTGGTPTENWTPGSISVSRTSPTTLGLTSGLDIGDGGGSGVALTHGPYSSSTETTFTFQVSGSQTEGSNPTKNDTVEFQYRYYAGRAAAGLASVTGSGELRSTPNNYQETFPEVGAPTKLYFIIPTAEFSGTLTFTDTKTQNNVPFSSSTFIHTNSFSHKIEYAIFESSVAPADEIKIKVTT
tara:strand:- start:935 stop:1954 length:1020 start_codon:yes stop_codon:yes gene_type:complete